MSYLALYRKYRPSSFSDLVGQSEISTIIRNEILNDKISHAYLFSGPRGTGKTSTAKIIAKMINCEHLSDDGIPCGKCLSCLNFDASSDVVEIDAASNNGVDEIRELRDKVNLVPTYGKYKIYIIDEVHMLTTQAFNALLKTLEEPPAHVIFILATTEFYKIPSTVVSRCQKFQFLKFSDGDIVDRLRKISNLESINISDDILFEIARLSDGGMRDAINMLDQLSSFSGDSILIDDVYRLNGVVSYRDFSKIFCDIYYHNVVSLVNFFDELDHNGKSLDRFVGDFINFLKDLLVFKNTNDFVSNSVEKKELLSGISDFYSTDDVYAMIMSMNDLILRMKNSSFSKILLITEFIKLSNRSGTLENGSVVDAGKNGRDNIENTNVKYNSSGTDKLIDNTFNSSLTLKKDNKSNNKVITDKEKKLRVHNAFALASKELKSNVVNMWHSILDKLSDDVDYVSIAGMMNDVEVMVVAKNYIIFVAQYDSLIDRLYDNVDVIEKMLKNVFQRVVKAVFLMNDEWNYEKEKYVSCLKNGERYDALPDNYLNFSDDDDDVKKIVSFLGNDIIVYE